MSCTFALGFGLLGLALRDILYRFDPRLMFVAIKLGSIAVLLPIYFTVCHRMIPFFAGACCPAIGRRDRCGRSARSGCSQRGSSVAGAAPRLRAAVARRPAHGCAIRLGCCGDGGRGRIRCPPLLRVLFVGFAWLPIAFALYAVQSLWYA